MKNNKDFNKFAKRNTHKRRAKDKARAELLRAVKEVEANYSNFKLKDTYDGGRGGRISSSLHRDQISATGVFSSSKSGFGFVKLIDRGGEDIFIPERRTAGAIDGDKVAIVYHKYKSYDGEERTEGKVTEILEYGRVKVIGTLDEEIYRHGRRTYRSSVIIPDDPHLTITPYVSDTKGALVGDKVIARLVRNKGLAIECVVTDILGHTESMEANYLAILAETGIQVDFSKEEIDLAHKVASTPISLQSREQFDDFIFTMDGSEAKDLDDAVSLRKTQEGYLLGVHIADVSEYVKERTALDRCATSRGTSTYFVDKVVPMLPPSLSNGACSLNAGEKKYALSALISLDERGKILNTKITESVIESRLRGVYSEINQILDGNGSDELLEKYRQAIPSINLMKELYEKLLLGRKDSGYIDFDTEESVILLDEQGEPVAIERRNRGISERIIEQFMLLANEAVAELLFNKAIPCVYRIHEEPPKEKFADFVDFVHNMGFDTSIITKNEPSPLALGRLLEEAERRGNFAPVSRAMLRAMSKAEYSAEKKGHFGLGTECYCHFTSPIRRLADLATHRIIKRVLIEGKKAESYTSYARRAAAAATEAELRSEEAERRIENLYKCTYMLGHLGEIFNAEVSSVTQFGLFCITENTCEGLVPISELDGEFFFDEKTLTLRSKDISYHIADRLCVMLEEVDIIRGKLRFSIVDENTL